MSRPPAPPVYFFLLDVSQEAVRSGMLEMIVHVIKDTISKDLLLGGPRTMVGIVSYDSAVHFYNMKSSLKQPQMIVVNDLEELFLPVPDELLLNLSESKDMLLNLLDSFNGMFAHQENTGSCLPKAITAAVKVFKHLGGKLIITQASDFLITPNSQKNGEKNTNPNDEKNNLLPSSPFYCNLSAELHHAFISVTIFVFSKTFKDIITLGEMARYLNGDLFYYPDKPMRKQSFFYDLKNVLIKDYTWEAVFRIRASKGWQISRIYGNFIVKSTDLLSVPNIDESKSLVYEFNLMDDVCPTDMFSIQTALLYTTSNGERRIRCHNYVILLTNSMNKIYDSVDSSVVTNHFLRQGLEKIYKTADIGQVKSFLITRCREIVRQSSILKQATPGAISLHDNLQSFPLNILGILKSMILNGKYDKSTETDERNACRIHLNCLPVDETLTYFVPYLFCLLEMRDGETGTYDEAGNFLFPSTVPLSYTSLRSTDFYLMDEGTSLIMFLGKNVDPTTLNNIFGVSSVNDVKEFNEDMLYHNSKDVINERIYNIITELRSRKSNKYCPLVIIKEGGAGETDQRFFYNMIQDKLESYPNGYNLSYTDFYQTLSR